MINKDMETGDKITDFLKAFKDSLTNGTFVKASLGHYRGEVSDLKNISIRKTVIKNAEKLSFTYKYKSRDIVKNYDFDEALSLVEENLQKDFLAANLYSTEFDLNLEIGKKGDFLKKSAASQTELPDPSHDRQKNRLVGTDRPYLQSLGITNEAGTINKAANDKYRQINRYIEILDGLIRSLPHAERISIADMGSGKGYLTFALYDYLTHNLNKAVAITGVEFRKDMVELCNKIARNSSFTNLSFEQGTIGEYKTDRLNVLIALHACDTATDDAIAKGIKAEADLIVVAPCCHKQIRRELESGKTPEELSFLLKHGIFMERQAEMATDALRSLILEAHGYTTKVFEFISDSHTPKNVMITAERTKKTDAQKKQAQAQIDAAKSFFGIGIHHLEKALSR